MSQLLRYALIADAAATAATGLLLLLANAWFAPLVGMPPAWLSSIGLVLLVYAAAVGYLSTRPAPPPVFVWAVIAATLLWAIDSVLAVALGWIGAAPLGVAFVVAQAVAVLVFADLQYLGLRRSTLTWTARAGLTAR